jgi:serine/threonine protein phosphatase PrpC
MIYKFNIIDSISDVGKSRKINEDSYIIDSSNEIVIVSDGMGGHKCGDIASKIVIEKFHQELKDVVHEIDMEDEEISKRLAFAYLQHAVEQSSLEIESYAHNNDIKNIIGATVVGMFHLKESKKIVIFHLGDSRIYRLRESIEVITKDHINELADSNNNVLSKAIGNFETFEIELKFIDYNENDIYLVCTDGVYNGVSDKDMFDIISQNRDICNNLKTHIYKNGAKDNLTAAIIKMEL